MKKDFQKIAVLAGCLAIAGASLLVHAQTSSPPNEEKSLINVNPDPNGEPWIAGGITREEWAASIADIPELGPPPRNALGKVLAKPLPDQVDNSTLEYFRPIFNQKGGSCAQASSIGYVFTYEINCFREVPGNVADNQYPYDFTYNLVNGGSGNNGSYPSQAWAFAKALGIPNVTAYGGFGLGKYKQWVSGYPVYYNAMTNRISGDFTINTSKPDGVTKMKQWLYDHQNGSSHGGCLVMCYNATDERLATIKTGLPEAGKKIMYEFGYDGGHAISIVGYNDSVRYDYNGDGKYTNSSATDVKTWEIGAYLIVNSWGSTFGSSGKAWIPYRLLATSGGIWESTLYGMKTQTEKVNKPSLTYKIVMSHSQRNQIRMKAGYANSPTATAATDTLINFAKAFSSSYSGSLPMQGINSDPIEIGLDVSGFIPKLTNSDVSLFLVIESRGGTGNVASFSLLDYTGGDTPLEIPCSRTNVDLPVGTTTLKITRTMQPLMTLTPNGGEKLERGRTFTITWYDRFSENVKIELLKGNAAASTIASSAPSDGAYEWAIAGDLPVGSDYKIKISSISDAAKSDASDSSFSIQEKTKLELTSPVGGEYLEKGKAFQISWSSGTAGDLVIDLYKDRMPETTIVAKVSGAGPYSWTPSLKMPSGNTYSIRLASKANPLVVFDESKDFFAIVNPILKGQVTQNFDSWNVRDSVTLLDSWEQSRDDEMDWYIHTGPTPSKVSLAAGGRGTGPNGDHTTGKNNFIYLESSYPNNPTKLAVFLSPMINTSGLGNIKISFWYHMYSREGRMGDFFVDLFVDGAWKDSAVHYTGDHGDQWHEQVIKLNEEFPQMKSRPSFVQVRFRGTTGLDYDGDICIDDFRLEGDAVPVARSPSAGLAHPRIIVRGDKIKYHNENGRLSVIMLNGSKIVDVAVKGSGTVDLTKLSHGVYCVKVNNETIKIVR